MNDKNKNDILIYDNNNNINKIRFKFIDTEEF